jgi:hypothetical protein
MVRPNPNAIRIDPATGGVENAVMFLRGVDPSRARPWDHGPVRVVMKDYQFCIQQADADSAYGFVRSGDAVEVVSQDPVFHALHTDGPVFLSLMFPDANQPLTRRFEHKGVVELTSAAGYSWMRAYLFVDDQPYYARTNSHGEFLLDGIPQGRYELMCWLPNWEEARHEWEPETALVTRIFFRPPHEVHFSVTIDGGHTLKRSFGMSAEVLRQWDGFVKRGKNN